MSFSLYVYEVFVLHSNAELLNLCFVKKMVIKGLNNRKKFSGKKFEKRCTAHTFKQTLLVSSSLNLSVIFGT